MRIIELNRIFKRYHKREYYFSKKDFFWAIKDITFSVNKGEILGMIGPNGAGKTTLMRLISGITSPTRGNIRVEGKVVPLIRMEGALNSQLSARENMLLLTAALGVKRARRKKIFQDIVEFSGISEYMDMQVAKLSSGMISRFSFSIAVSAPSDILLIDEVLTVGDQSFQRQCFAKMDEFKKEGKTIIFVSHNMEGVKNICDRVIWLDRGRIVKEGLPQEVIYEYSHSTSSNNSKE